MFDHLDAVLLARIQFAFTVSYHIIFPAFTIGLAAYLAVLEGLYLKTSHIIYKEIYLFWVKIFAVCFGLGVVSGIVLSYQFGTNWSVFSQKTGNILGPLLGYEVLTAFFLEASFLGIMLFGWARVSNKMHFASTCIVAVGTLISAFWILSANSWMQTPQGFEIDADGVFYPTNWMEIIFNPSFLCRLAHMSLAAYLSTSFVVGGVAGYYLFKKIHIKHAKIMLFMAMLMAALIAPLQLFVGDVHGLNTFKHQGAKLAAMEGIWESEKGAGLRLFAIPDAQNEKNHYELVIPKLASLILTHSWDGEVKGLKEWPKSERPPVGIVFWSFRVMVGIGFLMIGTGFLAVYLYARKRLYTAQWFHCWCMIMAPSGFVALLAGWFVTEVGRQPYTVYGILKTTDSASPAIIAEQIILSLGAFIVVYILMLMVALYYIFRMIYKGPQSFNHKDQYYAHSMEAAFTHSLLQGKPNHD